MDQKKPRMKKEQQQLLLNSLMTNPEMVNGNSQLPATKRLWADLTVTLNGIGGVRKTQNDWLETYKLLARRAKAKLRTQRASMNRTGGGPPTDVKLTDLEKKTLSIEGTSTIYGLPGAIEAGIVIVPASQPIINNNNAANIEQNVVMVLDETEEPESKQDMIDTVIVIDKHSDFREEAPMEVVIANALPATASHDRASVVGRAVTTPTTTGVSSSLDVETIENSTPMATATDFGRMTTADAPIMTPAGCEGVMVGQATSSCNNGVTTAREQSVEGGVPHRTPHLRRRPRGTPRTLVPSADTAAPQDEMIAALREGAQAQMALANAQIEVAQHLGACITRAATMIVEALDSYKNK